MNLVRVLIIDDSRDFSSHLSRALDGGKVKTTCVSHADEAIEVCKSQKFQLFLIDCMLPKMNGTELAKKLHEIQPDAKIIMMSGIFKDNSFASQLRAEPHISDFFAKPFEVKDVKDYIRRTWSNVAVSELSDMYPFLKVFNNASSVVNFLEKTERISSYSLPKILSSLLQFNIHGTLNFKRDDIEKEIIISNKKVVRVSSNDHSYPFGELLTELGFISKENLDAFCSSPDFNKSDLPIGKKLEKYNLISPHASTMVNKHQMKMRLTDLFESGNFSMSFTEHDIKPVDDSHFTMSDIEKHTGLWAKKHIAHTWLAEVFAHLKDQKPFITNHDELTSVHLDRISSGLKASKTIEHVNPDLEPTELYKSLFYAFSLNIISLGTGAVEGAEYNISLDIESLKKLQASFVDQEPFAILGVEPDISDKDLQKKYHAMAKNLHPDKLPLNISDELKALAEDTFSIITEAFNSIKTQETRMKYMEDKKQSEANEFMDNETAVVQAKSFLLKSKYSQAFKALDNETLKSKPPSLFNLYYCWACIKAQGKSAITDQAIKAFNSEPSSLKDSVEGYFVRSLILLLDDDIRGFEEMVKICLKKEPSFLPARRELTVIKSKVEEQSQKSTGGWSLFKKSS